METLSQNKTKLVLLLDEVTLLFLYVSFLVLGNTHPLKSSLLVIMT